MFKCWVRAQPRIANQRYEQRTGFDGSLNYVIVAVPQRARCVSVRVRASAPNLHVSSTPHPPSPVCLLYIPIFELYIIMPQSELIVDSYNIVKYSYKPE
jgi:hypothetical protein